MRALRPSLFLGCAAGALLTCGAAAAQDTSASGDTLRLDTIVVEGESEGSSEGVLATRTDEETLERRFIEDFDDLGRRAEAGVSFDEDSGSINFRGLGEDRILTTIDGIRLPWLNDGARGTQGGLNSIDFDTLSTLDIVRGSDSSVYGSGALAGRVALRTLDPEDLIFGQERFGVLTKSGYDSADDSWYHSTAVAARAGDTYMLVQGGYRQGHETETQGDVGGYGATRSEANPLDYDQYSLLVKLQQYIEGGHRFGITGELFSRDSDTDLRTGQGTATYDPGNNETGESVDRRRASLEYDYDAPGDGALITDAGAVLYFQQQVLHNTQDAIRNTDSRASIPGFFFPGGVNPYQWPSGVYTRDNELEQNTVGFLGDVSTEFATGDFDHRLTFGVDLSAMRTEQYSSGEDNCPEGFVYPTQMVFPFPPFVSELPGPITCQLLHTNQSDMPDVNGYALGLYVEDRIALNDRVRLTPGLRFDWYEQNPQETDSYADNVLYDGTLPPSSSDYAFSPKLLAEWDVNDEVTLYAQWAQGFRAPTANELYLDYGGVGTYRRIGNPELDPETSNSFEAGARYDNGTFSGGVSLFNTYYRDFIDTVQLEAPGGDYPLGGVQGYINREHVQIYGLEATAALNLDNGWHTWASLAYARGRDTDEDIDLNSVAPLTAIVGIGYAADQWGADLSVKMAAERDRVENPGVDFEAPGYAVVDVTAWWQPTQVEGLRLQAGVFNVFDTTYYDAVSIPDGALTQPQEFYSEPGRTFRASLVYNF